MKIFILIGATAGLIPEAGFAVEDKGIAFFESKIRPVLVENCYECHSIEAKKSKGDLLLDSREAIRRGGERGAAVVPGDPDESVFMTAIRHLDPDLEMPPNEEQLGETVIADFRRWIAMGAPDPREETVSGPMPPVSIEAGRAFWSFKKPVAAPRPETKNPGWAKRELDHFILAALEKDGLAPSPVAEPPVLLRRLHFDLAGLPPSPRDLSNFEWMVRERGLDAAMEVEVDRLLASDRYAERWARHWMDVARFAESSGKESNITFPHAWRYRDYAIDAFRVDMPYDRFLVEQIAGDLLPYESDEERARLLIATGFLAFGTKGLNEMNKDQFAADVADEQIDTITRAVMGQSVACARCHDHKFDPFSMRDYYALAGIFRSTKTFYGTWIDSENRIGGDLITLPRLENELIPNPSIPPKKLAEFKAKLAALNDEEAAGLKSLKDALRVIWQRGGIEGKLETVDDEGKALPLCMGTLDRDVIKDSPVFDRGEVDKPMDAVRRAFPGVIELPSVNSPPRDASGRLEFAKWLTHPDHPLTSRVMANRVWKHLFGRGIVRTMDNFGFNGERPDHPELLDHLALRFVEGGWSVKALIREVVLSSTYRQSSDWREEAFLKDPDNRLLWRTHKRRLEAECIRDAMLFVSGELDTSRRPASLVAEVQKQSVALYGFDKRVPRDLDGVLYRSVYLPVIRDRLPDVLALFDFAEPTLVTGQRDTTNVPVQALYLMNSPFVIDRSSACATRLKKSTDDPALLVRRAYRHCFSRPPDSVELKDGLAFLESHGDAALEAFCQALLSTAEFRNID